MRILIAHNYYKQSGGEDVVFEAEAAMLQSRGHFVRRYVVHNAQIAGQNKLKLAANTVWNGRMHRELASIVRDKQIDVAHFHNTFPLISPAAYSAVREAGAAVVQTLHNYRVACPSGVLCRDGHACTECVGRTFAWPAVQHGCYRGSRAATTVVALMQFVHRTVGTWQNEVDLYIAPSESTKAMICSVGFIPQSVVVKPHFVSPDPLPGDGASRYAIFLGRLSEEKGLHTLLRAWNLLKCPPVLKIVGDGPLAPLENGSPASVEWCGRLPMTAAYDLIGKASALIFPSVGHETFGRVIAEAFAKGTPVIASRLGTAVEMVSPGRTGLLFEPGSAEDLACAVEYGFSDPSILRDMRVAARREYEMKYHEHNNYQQLLSIYKQALNFRHGGATHLAGDDKLGRWQPAGF